MNESDNIALAEDVLAHVETTANRDTWHGDREAYMMRHLHIAQTYALLAVAEEVRALTKAYYSSHV